MPQLPEFEFDVCLSFAGERRPYVVQVAELLQGHGIRVFYDGYEEENLWGKDLYEYLDYIYRSKSRFCILFISQEYAQKVWTTHERKSAQARALQENAEYILPVRFDDTEVPGIRPTVGYIDLRTTNPSRLVELVVRKLASVGARELSVQASGPAYSTVPVTAEERAIVASLRPSGWEYFLFSGVIVEGKERLRPKKRDFELGYSKPTKRFRSDRDAIRYMSDQLSYGARIIANTSRMFDVRAQEAAFGKHGEPGNVDNIEHLGKRFIDSYEAYFDWAADIRGAVTSRRLERAFELVARMICGPVRQVEQFIDDYADQVRGIPDLLAVGGPVRLGISLILNIDDDVVRELDKEMKRLNDSIGDSD